MASKTLFRSATATLPGADATNAAGGRAYDPGARHQLAQLAATGCLGGTFYQSGAEQLDRLKSLADQVDDEFLAKLAVYSRQRAFMKDMPAALLTLLAARDPKLLHAVFGRVVDNGRMLRNVFQMVRSGRLGKRSLSSSLQRAFGEWLNEASVGQLLAASVGADPSLRDVLRLARPTPSGDQRRALFGWLVGKPPALWGTADESDLPEQARLLQAYHRSTDEAEQVALVERLSVRWDMLAGNALGKEVWKALAERMGPQALRMNLNTLMRHGVVGTEADPAADARVAQRLADAEAVRRSRQFPYQYLAAYRNATHELPQAIRQALCTAAEIACGNVPKLAGPVVIGVDVSGSMASPVTGHRGGGTSAMRCVDAAAVFAAAVLRANPDSLVVPFDHRVHEARFDAGDTVLSVADRLAAYGGGATECSLPIRYATERHGGRTFAGVVLVSDNQSWIGEGRYGSTAVMEAWTEFAERQRELDAAAEPKLVCIDVQPYGTVQAPERPEILNVGGFSDAVFGVVDAFLRPGAGRFVAEVEAVAL